MEKLSLEKLQKLQLAKFKKIVKWDYDNSTFHLYLYRNSGPVPADINSLDDILKMPKVKRYMMRSHLGIY